MTIFLLLALLGLASCTAPPETAPTADRGPIINGHPDTDHDAVVQIVGRGGQCSGTFISPSLILTAHHCLVDTQGRDWDVSEGQRAPLADLTTGREVILPEEVSVEVAEDLALLVTGKAPVVPYLPAVDLEEDLRGSLVTVVGYGEDEDGVSGHRQQATMTVAEVDPLTLTLVGSAYPYFGDSGGPVFDSRGQVIGVISRGWDGAVIVVRVDQHRWFIDPVLRENEGCVPGDPELCDGYDNNCDGELDTGCSQLAEACGGDEDCVEGECEDVIDERICTLACAPERGTADCWPGAYCFETSCEEGLCRAGEQGSSEAGDPCDDDTDCLSLTCRDFGAGGRRCTNRCHQGALECAFDEVCQELDGSCGGCIDTAGAEPGGRGLGELCQRDDDCEGALVCGDDPPLRYCTQPCSETDDGCPEGTHCRQGSGLCVRGELGETGAVCVDDSDCSEDECGQAADGATFCTEICRPGRTCPPHFSCDFEAERCRPSQDVAVLGQRCDGAEGPLECLEGDCVEDTEVGESRCSRPCELTCPTDFECRQVGDQRLCWPTPAPADEGGCGCAVAGAASGLNLSRLGELLLSLWS